MTPAPTIIGAMSRTELGQFEEAIADYDQAIRLSGPDDAYVYTGRAHAKTNLGQYEEAVADFDHALSLEPHNAYVYTGRAHAKTELGQFEEAIADLKVAVELAQEAGDSDLVASIEQQIQELEQE